MQFMFSKTTLASSLTHLLFWSYSIFVWIFQKKISDNNRLDTRPVAKHVKAALKDLNILAAIKENNPLDPSLLNSPPESRGKGGDTLTITT